MVNTQYQKEYLRNYELPNPRTYVSSKGYSFAKGRTGYRLVPFTGVHATYLWREILLILIMCLYTENAIVLSTFVLEGKIMVAFKVSGV